MVRNLNKLSHRGGLVLGVLTALFTFCPEFALAQHTAFQYSLSAAVDTAPLPSEQTAVMQELRNRAKASMHGPGAEWAYIPQLGQPVHFSAFVAGDDFACGIDPARNNSIVCAGDNTYGQRGAGNRGGSYDISWQQPVLWESDAGDLKPLTQVSQIYAGAAFACAVYSRNGVQKLACWGRNDQGQLGVKGMQAPSAYAKDVDALPANHGDIVSLHLSNSEVCAVMTSADAPQCWGGQSYGQINHPIARNESPT